MGFLHKLFGKNSLDLNDQEIVDTGACPNCWGKQEYENEYKAFSEDQTKANINHDKAHQKAFVAQFVETHVSGIKLKTDGDKLHCPKCNARF